MTLKSQLPKTVLVIDRFLFAFLIVISIFAKWVHLIGVVVHVCTRILFAIISNGEVKTIAGYSRI